MNNFLQQINSYIKEAFNAGKYLYNGLSVTFDHLRRRPVTVQYPYEKLIPSERYRGRIHYEFDKCIACEVCVRVCPINCLLYTSPSPRDRTRSRMPSSA